MPDPHDYWSMWDALNAPSLNALQKYAALGMSTDEYLDFNDELLKFIRGMVPGTRDYWLGPYGARDVDVYHKTQRGYPDIPGTGDPMSSAVVPGASDQRILDWLLKYDRHRKELGT